MTDRRITEERHDIATSALYEISEIAALLQKHIAEEHRNTGLVVARGMLARVQKLSEVADECLGNGDDWDDATLRRIVHAGTDA